ncbi:unnamed protein product [Effrenium voratum]|uniref:Uncharacterized protein n=1 Tax=Effrenium voratum TaxID=2562239 RepID=A0AA36NF52_9DINO|nr:unnamed protein product [Effrenium voratum]CAJ1450331.1 unnamed protein product [Effrenium voratum]
MATALGGQDPFTMPMSIVIKDHLKYARAIMRSAETRWHFDQGALSEPGPRPARIRTLLWVCARNRTPLG